MTLLNLKAQTAQTCLAKGAALTAAAMRCGYDGFEETSFTQPNSAEMQLGAKIEGKESFTRSTAPAVECISDSK